MTTPTSSRRPGDLVPLTEPSYNQPTIRDEPGPDDNYGLLLETDTPGGWTFGEGEVILSAVRGELWRGEGARCSASYPPSRFERSVRCELVADHLYPFHFAQRSSV